jgi:hypothetical protein
MREAIATACMQNPGMAKNKRNLKSVLKLPGASHHRRIPVNMDCFRVTDHLNSGLDAKLWPFYFRRPVLTLACVRAGTPPNSGPGPFCDPIPFAAIGKDKRGEIVQERLMQPALTCV